jgi:four helix bundle protein
MSNIAEGFERRTTPEFARFLDIAKASAGELRSLLYVAEDLDYLKPEVARNLRDKAIALSRGIAALSRHLRK